MKVLFLTNIPSPYRVKFFNILGKMCNLTVLFERKASSERDERWKKLDIRNFTPVFLRGIKIGNGRALSIEVVKYIWRERKDSIIVISGYNTPSAIVATVFMRLCRIPYILSADGAFVKNEIGIVRYLKKWLISSATCWLSTSKETDLFFTNYGANINQIYRYPFSSVSEGDVVDEIHRNQIKKLIRDKMEIDASVKMIISVGQFIHRKGFDILLNACKDLKQQCLIYIIGGQPTDEYKNIIKESGISGIYFLPFMSSEELKEYYLASDVFVLPTREDVWGLVINEATAAGLPIITTNRCIAGVEMIDGNGIIVEVDNSKELAKAINKIITDSVIEDRYSLRSIKIAHKYTIESMANAHYEVFTSFLKGLEK